jgi:hypothetical protein
VVESNPKMLAVSPKSEPTRSPRLSPSHSHTRHRSNSGSLSPLPSPLWFPPPPPAPPTPEEARRRKVANLMHGIQLVLQCLAVISLLSVITYMTFNATGDLAHWKWYVTFELDSLGARHNYTARRAP